MDMSLDFRRLLLAGSIACIAASQAQATVIVSSAIRSATATLGAVQTGQTSLLTSGDFQHTASLNQSGLQASASQTSSIGALVFSGNGSGNIQGGGGDEVESVVLQGNSTFVLDFTLDTNYFFDLSVILHFVVEDGNGLSLFTLDGPGTSISAQGEEEFLRSGTLGPGSYHLEAAANALATPASFSNNNFFASTRSSFTLTLREVTTGQVPEPMTLALLSTGLLGMALMRSRRKT